MMEVLVFLLLFAIKDINCLEEEKVNLVENVDDGLRSENWNQPLSERVPYNLTNSLERFLGRWVKTDQGSFYFFKYPDPRVTGYIPGVVMSARQAVETDVNALFEEAYKIQAKIEEILAFYHKMITKTSLELMNAQLPRFDYLKKVERNETELDEIKLDVYDKDWIFGFAVGAIETETIMRGYKQLLKKINYILKKIICARRGQEMFKEGHVYFIMVFAETLLEEKSASELIYHAQNGDYAQCQFVEASKRALKYEFYDVIVSTRSKVLEMMGNE